MIEMIITIKEEYEPLLKKKVWNAYHEDTNNPCATRFTKKELTDTLLRFYPLFTLKEIHTPERT